MFNYKWNFKDYPKEKNGFKVFSTFACGGGSSMGYKLAGYDVIAANDIDKEMRDVYVKNHNPKHFYLCSIADLLKEDLSKELYDIDILDGSPPCSAFSMTGLRDKVWGKEKHFREGQAKQVLDDLFFDLVDVAKELKPKVVVAENVKGMLIGNAKGYVMMIADKFNEAGYNVQVFLLNAAMMGVPQIRERVFFICTRKDLKLPKIKLEFNEPQIVYGKIRKDVKKYKRLTELYVKYWHQAKPGRAVGKYKSLIKLKTNAVVATVLANNRHYDCYQPRKTTDREISLISSFPLDYDRNGIDLNYLIGMSVPPVMIARIAKEIEIQLLNKITKS